MFKVYALLIVISFSIVCAGPTVVIISPKVFTVLPSADQLLASENCSGFNK